MAYTLIIIELLLYICVEISVQFMPFLCTVYALSCHYFVFFMAITLVYFYLCMHCSLPEKRSWNLNLWHTKKSANSYKAGLICRMKCHLFLCKIIKIIIWLPFRSSYKLTSLACVNAVNINNNYKHCYLSSHVNSSVANAKTNFKSGKKSGIPCKT